MLQYPEARWGCPPGQVVRALNGLFYSYNRRYYPATLTEYDLQLAWKSDALRANWQLAAPALLAQQQWIRLDDEDEVPEETLPGAITLWNLLQRSD